MTKVSYAGWKNCIRLSNGKIELIATTDVGPRIIRLGFVNSQNFMKEYKQHLGLTGGKEWRIYGGHRLWHAPEDAVRTYWPDNTPVKARQEKNTLYLSQSVEGSTGLQKEIDITIDTREDSVTLVHRINNKNLWEVELSLWCLSVMSPGGRAIIPQEEFRPHPDYLLPARPVVLWHYTNMKDPRWIWGEKYIQLKQNTKYKSKQKVGLLNKKGWGAYYLNGELFVKRYDYTPKAVYPDYGCNTELYTDQDMLEFETLSPVTRILPGGKVEHTEKWYLYKTSLTEDESELDKTIKPLFMSR
ncbi:MAG: hypothetical protein WC955_05760 [Elusimicrobiota bacterium]